MKKRLSSLTVAVIALAGIALAEPLPLPANPTITSPAAGYAFEAGTTNMTVFWTPDANTEQFELQVLHNAKLFATVMTADSYTTVDQAFPPGYYSLFVRGSNSTGVGNWSPTGLTVTVRREMIPSGLTTNKQPKAFRWSRSAPASRYLFKLAQFNKTTGKYDVKITDWIPQSTNVMIKWVASKIPDGKYRWTVTDYQKDKAGYTQSALFRIQNSGFQSWNDPKLINGTWKVLDTWRWGELTFFDNGVLRTTQPNGISFTRARWYADEKTLTLISDVTEHCPYTVTDKTLTFTTPKGNTHRLSRP